jgi:diadenosine tetraphosphate (Ap4A) HIT family hydrolase
MGGCPLCGALSGDGLLVEATDAVAVMDTYPLNPGHCLVVPRRHTPLFWDLSAVEISDIFSVLAEARGLIDQKFSPDGYNIGVNVGAAAGQTTIDHVHVHLVPRYRGDDDDPRGGVRWILPERAVYWET